MKYAAVTGSTRGIGRSIAEKLLREGYFVFVNYASDNNGANEFEEHNIAFSGRFIISRIPIDSYENALAFSNVIRGKCENLDVLILNSATTDITSFGVITEDSWNHVINTNLSAPFFLVQHLADIISDRVGRIIFISSLMAEVPHARSIAYGVSKAAVNNLAMSLVKFFSEREITVNAVEPGFADTPWQKRIKTPEHRRRVEEKIALKRFANPDEVASLCMEIIRNQYINGSVLRIDGGYSYM